MLCPRVNGEEHDAARGKCHRTPDQGDNVQLPDGDVQQLERPMESARQKSRRRTEVDDAYRP